MVCRAANRSVLWSSNCINPSSSSHSSPMLRLTTLFNTSMLRMSTLMQQDFPGRAPR